MPPIIHIKNLCKTYKTHKRESGVWSAVKSLFHREHKIIHALKNVSFDIDKGEIVGFIGPNGAGKSTTIKAMSGILYPTSGEIEVLGFTPWQDRVKFVKNIGVVFGQKTSLHWDLPPVDTFHLNKVLYDIPDKEFDARLKKMAKLLDVEEVIKKPVRDLSLGERMKCEIISALLHNPPLVFLDEPTIGLDVVAKDKFREFIKEVNEKEGTTFIVTTHDMQDIELLCKRIIVINHGRIVYDGDIAKVRQEFHCKHIEVKLNSKGKKFRLKGCKVISQEEFDISLELDTHMTNIKALINHLVTEYDVADIVVSDPPIEEIIQTVFRK
ncbi:ATP-binding cassette domain-containing protein [Candidatus Woesearchaeota archaeon]|nr:ATP-binding cassette domain-containing protein [Candidatus Woesearchaeota archaeon]